MSLEGNKRSGLLEAGAFAAALLGAIDHGPAQALEMPHGMSWEQGVRERIRGAVMKEPMESEAMHLRFTDGTSTWAAVYAGKAEIITDEKGVKKMTVQNTLQQEISYLSKNFRGKTVETRCSIHTHPDAFKQSTTTGIEFSPPYEPPSTDDVKKSVAGNSFRRTYAILGIDVKDDISAAADTKGIWYFNQAGREFNEKNLEEFKKIQGTFIGRSYFNKNFNFDTEYQKLRQAYRDYLGADVRFVSYEDISKEPPCAGVDYKPGTLKPNYDVRVNQPESVPRQKGLAPKIESQGNAPTRPSLGYINKPGIRPRLDDQQGPPIFRVGPPQR